jgi:uncharacterized protein YrrD
MLFKAKTLTGYTLHSLDKDLGKVDTFYFDDEHWTIRYLVADTGNWLSERKVLISPYALMTVNEDEKNLSVNLTHQQIEESPNLGSDEPVSQQFEQSYFSYYGWPSYWDGLSVDIDPTHWQAYAPGPETWDLHLRSIQKVIGYHIQAQDGTLGHVEDFILDVDTWTIRYLIVNTNNWWPGKKILISPTWIESISWKQSKVFVEHLRKTIKEAPAYNDLSQLTREAESELYEYYDRQGYWVDALAANEHRLK